MYVAMPQMSFKTCLPFNSKQANQVNHTQHSDQGDDKQNKMSREQRHEYDTRHHRQHQTIDSTRHRNDLHDHLRQRHIYLCHHHNLCLIASEPD